jgi:hypothetical protein
MRAVITILFLMIFFNKSYGQNNGCVLPTPTNQFNQLKRNITNQPNLNNRLQTAINTVQGICLNVPQLLEVLAIFPQDEDKLDIAVYGINNLVNGQDFYYLYDAFSSFSAAIRFHDYVNMYFGNQQNVFLPPAVNVTQNIVQPISPITPVRPVDPIQPVRPVEPVPAVPPVIPVCEVTSQQFSMIRNTLAAQPSSSSRVSITKAQLPTFNCYTSAQLKEIVALFPSSSDKLEIAKFGYDYVSDKANYFFTVSGLLPSSSDREALSTYIAGKGR